MRLNMDVNGLYAEEVPGFTAKLSSVAYAIVDCRTNFSTTPPVGRDGELPNFEEKRELKAGERTITFSFAIFLEHPSNDLSEAIGMIDLICAVMRPYLLKLLFPR